MQLAAAPSNQHGRQPPGWIIFSFHPCCTLISKTTRTVLTRFLTIHVYNGCVCHPGRDPVVRTWKTQFGIPVSLQSTRPGHQRSTKIWTGPHSFLLWIPGRLPKRTSVSAIILSKWSLHVRASSHQQLSLVLSQVGRAPKSLPKMYTKDESLWQGMVTINHNSMMVPILIRQHTRQVRRVKSATQQLRRSIGAPDGGSGLQAARETWDSVVKAPGYGTTFLVYCRDLGHVYPHGNRPDGSSFPFNFSYNT